MSEIMRTKEYLLKAVSSVLNEADFALPQTVNPEKLYSLAKINAVTGMLFSLFQNEKSLPIYEKLLKEYKLSALRDNEQVAEIELIRKDFTENGIDFMLLKGTHLKELYPRPELRFMVDMDVLVRERDTEKAYQIIKSHGLTKKMESDKDFVFIRPPFLTVEVHKSLFMPENPFYPHFLGAFDKAEKCGEHEYKMKDDDLYIYTLAHLCEHYLDAGSCFRPCMDLYLLQKKRDLSFDYINAEIEKLGISEFAENIKKLLLCMFEGDVPNDTLTIMENYIVLGPPVKGAAVAAQNAVKNQSKSQLIIKTLFPPLSQMRHRYHVLAKLPFLLPLFWLVRIITFVFSKDERSKKHKADIISMEKSSVDIMNEIFKKSGLK